MTLDDDDDEAVVDGGSAARVALGAALPMYLPTPGPELELALLEEEEEEAPSPEGVALLCQPLRSAALDLASASIRCCGLAGGEEREGGWVSGREGG